MVLPSQLGTATLFLGLKQSTGRIALGDQVILQKWILAAAVAFAVTVDCLVATAVRPARLVLISTNALILGSLALVVGVSGDYDAWL